MSPASPEECYDIIQFDTLEGKKFITSQTPLDMVLELVFDFVEKQYWARKHRAIWVVVENNLFLKDITFNPGYDQYKIQNLFSTELEADGTQKLVHASWFSGILPIDMNWCSKIVESKEYYTCTHREYTIEKGRFITFKDTYHEELALPF
jgi:hypothetical protein